MKASLSAAPWLGIVAGANAAAAILTLRSGRNDPALGVRVRLDVEGLLWLRPARDDDNAIVAEPAFISAPLLVLAARDTLVPIWRDALPVDAFRHLTVAARWPRPPIVSTDALAGVERSN